MTKLHPDTVREIARELANELERRGLVANTNGLERTSATGIGALVSGDQCDGKDESEFMDPTSTETDGASSSPEQIAARLLRRSRTKPKRYVLPLRPERKAKAER